MPNYTYPGIPDDRLFDHVIEQARAAEAAGFDLVTVMDHLYQIRGVGPETAPMLEAYTTLAALATHTKKVKLGTLVTGVTYRNPADVMLTIGVGIILVKDEAEAKPLLEKIPPERRPMIRALNVEQAAEFLRPYIDAGFGGFTLNNPTLPTVEAIGRAGELIKAVRGSSVAA